MDSYGFQNNDRLAGDGEGDSSSSSRDNSTRDHNFVRFLKAISPPAASPILPPLDADYFASLTVRERAEFEHIAIAGFPVVYRINVYLSLTGGFVELVGGGRAGEEVDARTLDAINRDLDRTFPGHEYFEEENTQLELKRVLIRFALLNPSIGYCQGLNFIAGLFLLLTREINQTVHLLDYFAREIMPQGYYSEKMEGQYVDGLVFEHLARELFPKVYQKLKTLGLDFAISTFNWFATGFVNVFKDTESCYRVWDVCFVRKDGRFIMRVALALVGIMERDILKCGERKEAEDLFRVITRKVDIDALINLAEGLRMKGSFLRRGGDLDIEIASLRGHYRFKCEEAGMWDEDEEDK
ncbi:hypothetical protein TrLO_g14847 [Triparma laevis f. longispina]|uniref:Rab-GAP TBC domain-containing protein n=1 Tax=Triparma laevis f. longispina TaxID=1714387 RepID=A0A9W7FT98_9STRA|nr:hypothetical protein TrLO_g14847 [Triparma laevis f. longispina]